VFKRLTEYTRSDKLFALQIILAYLFAGAQITKLFRNTGGMTVTWMLFADVFILLNLWLAMKAHREVKSRDTWQARAIYLNWAVLGTFMALQGLILCPWTRADSIVSTFITIGAAGIISWAYSQQRKLDDPVVRGLLIGIFRVVPHCYIIYCISRAGSGSGYAGIAVLAANLTASLRIVTLGISVYHSGWNRNVTAQLVSECANEGSWLCVTGVWLYYLLH